MIDRDTLFRWAARLTVAIWCVAWPLAYIGANAENTDLSLRLGMSNLIRAGCEIRESEEAERVEEAYYYMDQAMQVLRTPPFSSLMAQLASFYIDGARNALEDRAGEEER